MWPLNFNKKNDVCTRFKKSTGIILLKLCGQLFWFNCVKGSVVCMHQLVNSSSSDTMAVL